jgi:hypothetical protein
MSLHQGDLAEELPLLVMDQHLVTSIVSAQKAGGVWLRLYPAQGVRLWCADMAEM